MIAVEACGISSNVLLMAYNAYRLLLSYFSLWCFLAADIYAAIFYINITLMNRNIKNTQPNHNQMPLLIWMFNVILISASIQNTWLLALFLTD